MGNKESSKRGAAGMAKATAGKSRVFKDKSKYNRDEEKKIVEQETISFAELKRLAFCNSDRLCQAVNLNGERHQWVGFGFVNEGELHGDEILVVD